MTTDSVTKQIADLHNLTHPQLQELWRTLHGKDAPAFNKPYLVKRLACRIQEIAFGGLHEGAYKAMDEILEANGYDEIGRKRGSRRRALRQKDGVPVAGTRLVREWNGQTYEVIVARGGGFDYQGRRYRSLSAVTKVVTGTHWNGRAFFGLKASTERKGKTVK